MAARVMDLCIPDARFKSKFIKDDDPICVGLTVVAQIHFNRCDARHSGFSASVSHSICNMEHG
jgi:hypothetical protein